ncbi:MAG: hypothetical protein NTAFB01_21080 [Nitrospira sp.]
MSQLLVVREVAAKLRLSSGTVYRLAKSGQLPCLKLGGALRFDADILKKFFEKAS